MHKDDDYFMQQALHEATLAEAAGEVPVGAVIVCQGEIIARAHNQPIAHHDCTAHAEILALRAASAAKQNYRLTDCALYVTLEPCAMCAGAMVHARLQAVHFATRDPRTGAAGSVFQLLQCAQLNHQVAINEGLYAEQSAKLLKQFFKKRREVR